MAFKFTPGSSGHENEHEALSEILNTVIPRVVRDRVFGEHSNYEEVDPEDISDKAILDAIEWDGTFKRREKWLLMAGEMVFQTEQVREKQSLHSDIDGKSAISGLGAFSGEPTNLNWQDRYNEAADAVAIYVNGASSSEAIKDGLRRQTFGGEISIQVPREVLRQLASEVRNRSELTVDEVIVAHREAVESL